MAFTISEDPPYKSNKTYTYQELIEVYQQLDRDYPSAKLVEMGKSDVGKPIHLFVINKDQLFSGKEAAQSNKSILLINNGIHPGESCGIDASVELAKQLLEQNNRMSNTLDSVIVLIVPVYNVGGMLNRGKYSRANQNGPEEHGFRGNAKNLDLNRDFIKCDSRNAKVFSQIFHGWKPHYFIDTHTTNGSDHQYTMTLIPTQKDKLNPILSNFLTDEMLPFLYRDMADKKMEMTPYIYPIKKDPNHGIKAFLETPRYSSGYAALFNCISFVTEAHVFKTYIKRVEQTKAFLESAITFSAKNNSKIKNIRQKAEELTAGQQSFAIDWELDSSRLDSVHFKGFKTNKTLSEVTNLEMMFYNKEQPISTKIPFYNSYRPKVEVNKPKFYIIPQAYESVIERLRLNQIELTECKADTLIEVTSYYIKDYTTVEKPYEHHYLHSDVKVEKKKEKLPIYRGDFLCSTDQPNLRYIIETLEPQSVDGFFAWNFMDGVLQQKEWFSDYAFEPKARNILKANPDLNKRFLEKKQQDSSFAKNNFSQLYYIYRQSKYYEPSVNRYPIFRID